MTTLRDRQETPAPPLPRGTLQGSSLGLIAGKVAQMGSGFVFWLVAANLSSAEEVGLTAALVSGVTLCTQFALLGVGAAIIRLFPAFAAAPRTLLDTAVTMVASTAVVAGAVFLLLNGLLGGRIAAVVMDPRAIALFLAMAVLGTLGALLDQVSMALGRGRQVLGRNVAGSVVTIGAAVVLGTTMTAVPAGDLFLCWVLGGAAATLIGVWQLRRALHYTYRPRPAGSVARLLLRHGVPNHVLTLSERVPALLLPILVTEFLSPTSTAHWYTVWMMAWAVYVMPVSVGIATFAEAARTPGRLETTLRESLRWSLKLGGAGAATLALAAVPVLSLLGPDYADEGAWPLRILLLAIVPVTLVQTYFSLSRAVGRMKEALVVGTVSACVAVGATTAGGLSHGLVGMAVAWVIVQTLTATWAGWRLVGASKHFVVRPPAEAAVPVPATAAPFLAPAPAAPVLAAQPGAEVPPSPEPLRPSPVRTPQTWHRGGHEPRPPVRHVRATPVALARRRTTLVVAALVVLLASCVASMTAAASFDMAQANDTGIIALLPAQYWAGLAATTIVFAALLVTRHAPDWLLGVCVVALVVILFGVPVVASDLPRLNVSFRHAGIVDNLIRTGEPDPTVDAYFSWPGFFMLGALVSEAAGFRDPVSLTHLAPLYSNLLYLPPLILVMRALTADRRRQWLAIWIFYLAQWPNQDYFAPQSYTYLLYLTCIALVLTWFCQVPVSRPARLLWRAPPAPSLDAAPLTLDPVAPELSVRSRALLFVTVTGLVLATVPSHQLTPYALVVALAVLALGHGRTVRTLATVTAVAALAWLLFAATVYVSGHLPSLLSAAGDIGRATNANVLDRIGGTPGHLLVVHVRLAFSAAIAVLAIVGAFRRLRQGRWDRTAVLLAGAAYLLVPMQPYGGEMLLRSYFFSLPFMAFLAAAALLPGRRQKGDAGLLPPPRQESARRWALPVAVVLVTAVLAPGMIVSRYGNARIDQFTDGEVRLISTMYAEADPGSYLFALANNVPWKSEEYEQHEYRIVDNMGAELRTPQRVAAHMTELADSSPAGGFFVITRSQRAYVEFYGGLGPAEVTELVSSLKDRYGWHLVTAGPEGQLWAKEGP